MKKILLWIYFNFIDDLIVYTPTAIGNLIRKLFYKRVLKSLGNDFIAKIGVKIYGFKYISIGNNVTIHPFSWIGGSSKLIIGNDVLISRNVWIMTQNHGFKRKDIPIRSQDSTSNELEIGDDVWIGTNAVINSGSRPIIIAKGVIIASNSVVLSSCTEEYGIYAGIPAKLVKNRFS